LLDEAADKSLDDGRRELAAGIALQLADRFFAAAGARPKSSKALMSMAKAMESAFWSSMARLWDSAMTPSKDKKRTPGIAEINDLASRTLIKTNKPNPAVMQNEM
jgi:hypothetical protein